MYCLQVCWWSCRSCRLFLLVPCSYPCRWRSTGNHLAVGARFSWEEVQEPLRKTELPCHLKPSLHKGSQRVLIPTHHTQEVILTGGQYAVSRRRSTGLADRDCATVSTHEPASDAHHIEAAGTGGMTQHEIAASTHSCAFKEAPDGVSSCWT